MASKDCITIVFCLYLVVYCIFLVDIKIRMQQIVSKNYGCFREKTLWFQEWMFCNHQMIAISTIDSMNYLIDSFECVMKATTNVSRPNISKQKLSENSWRFRHSLTHAIPRLDAIASLLHLWYNINMYPNMCYFNSMELHCKSKNKTIEHIMYFAVL